MRMHILIVVVVMTVAQFVAHPIAASLNDMYEMVLTEDGERTEDVRLVDAQDPFLQFCQRDWVKSLYQFFQHHDTVGCDLYPVLLEELCTFCFVHRVQNYEKASEIQKENLFFFLFPRRRTLSE